MSTALQQVTRRYEKVARAIARPMFRARLPSKTEDEGTFEALKNEGQVFTPTVQTLQCCHGASLRNSPNIVNGWFSIAMLDHPRGCQGKTVVGDANLAPPAPAAGLHFL